MASRGSTKALSILQEDRVAKRYNGKRSPSSGGSVSDQGDVRTGRELIECKHTGTYDKPAKSISVKVSDLEKIADEAWSEGRSPALALSIYAPDSVLANREGFIDLIVRLQTDDRIYIEDSVHGYG